MLHIHIQRVECTGLSSETARSLFFLFNYAIGCTLYGANKRRVVDLNQESSKTGAINSYIGYAVLLSDLACPES